MLFSFAGVSAGFFHPFTGLRQIFPPDTLPQLALVFVQLPLLLFINVFILFGPFLLMAVRGIRSYEPGDASWGVKIDDVRGQAEAKEEITRVITLWQSGEEFEQAGGKRERGLLFLGAPGTGKTMISKAIATNFNCPFVTIPGSGFAQMFMGMDALVVQFLARKAEKLARKWGGQCIVFIDEIDAVGMRRQALQGAGSGMSADAGTIHDFCFFGPNGSITPTGDLVIESRAWRERLFAQRAEAPRGHGPLIDGIAGRLRKIMPGMFGGTRDRRSTSCWWSWTDWMTRPRCASSSPTGSTPSSTRCSSSRRGSAGYRCAWPPHVPGPTRSTSSALATSRSRCSTQPSPGPEGWDATSGSGPRRWTTDWTSSTST